MARLNGGHEREKHCRANADRDAEQRERANRVVRIINRDPGHEAESKHERVAAPIGDRDSAGAAINERNKPSVKSCLIKRRRPAPSASRIVISCRRKSERASKRLLTLAQAMRRTKKRPPL